MFLSWNDIIEGNKESSTGKYDIDNNSRTHYLIKSFKKNC